MWRVICLVMSAEFIAVTGGERKPADRTPGKVTSKDVRRDAGQAVNTAVEFSQQAKVDFQKNLDSQLKNKDAEIAKLREKNRGLKDEAKANWDRKLADLESTRDAARVKLVEVGQSSEVFTNLLTNAAKYTDKGGEILLMAAEENNEVVVQLRDTGIGITAGMLPRIFDPFTQVTGALNRSEGGIGIGLGLAMVAHLVRLHVGTVQVFSDGPGHGSRFVVRLPLLLSLDTEDEAAGRPDRPPAESGSHCVEMSDE